MLEQTVMVRCPHCHKAGAAKSTLSGWNGESYEWSCCCGRAHLDPHTGGGQSWLSPADQPSAGLVGPALEAHVQSVF